MTSRSDRLFRPRIRSGRAVTTRDFVEGGGHLKVGEGRPTVTSQFFGGAP